MNFTLSCYGTSMLHSTTNFVIIISSIHSTSTVSTTLLRCHCLVQSLCMMKVGKFIPRHCLFHLLQRTRRMIDFTPTNCLPAHLETTGEKSTGRNIRE